MSGRISAREVRIARLAERRNLKMARSAHAFVRGATVRFYRWLEESQGRLPDGPPVWICGDCHLGNLGPLASVKGKVAVQVRDLDQTVIGNPAHDLVRLGLSLASAARGSDLPGVTTAQMTEALIAGYESGLGPERTEDTIKPPPVVKRILRRSVGRDWRKLARERLDDPKPTIPLGDRFWPVDRRERAAIRRLFEDSAIAGAVLNGSAEQPPKRLEMLDAAFWVKGCSSLGLLRYAVLLDTDEGPRLIDIKEAVAAAAPRAADVVMPRDNAQRVVAGARALSPHLGQRMAAARLLDRAVFMRELAPQDLKLEIDRLTRPEATLLAAYLGAVVGEAHGRQMDERTLKLWLAELGRHRPQSLEAPSWLWSSIVELSGLHEAEYLEHCRRYALVAA
jgi:uncharacterized protein (DUF2252 family)